MRTHGFPGSRASGRLGRKSREDCMQKPLRTRR
jgi:hypothetical protein